MLRFLIFCLSFTLASGAYCQATSEALGQSLGFKSHLAFLNATSYCLGTYSNKVLIVSEMTSCKLDITCTQRVLEAHKERIIKIRELPEWKSKKCDLILPLYIKDEPLTSLYGPQPKKTQFNVVAAVQSCAYFVGEQNFSHSLIKANLCSRPLKGEEGTGDISSAGFQNVEIGGATCSIYVEETFLGKTRALEKFVEKCP